MFTCVSMISTVPQFNLATCDSLFYLRLFHYRVPLKIIFSEEKLFFKAVVSLINVLHKKLT